MAKHTVKLLARMLAGVLLTLALAAQASAVSVNATAGEPLPAANATVSDAPVALGQSTEAFYNVNATAAPEFSGQGAVTGSLGETAADAFSEPPPDDEAPMFSWGGYFKGIGMLLVILAALWFVVWFLRRRGALPGMGGLPQEMFRIEAQIALGPKKRILLVRFLNSRLLLGVTDHSITLLKDVREGSDGREEPENKRVANFAELIEAASQKNDAS